MYIAYIVISQEIIGDDSVASWFNGWYTFDGSARFTTANLNTIDSIKLPATIINDANKRKLEEWWQRKGWHSTHTLNFIRVA